MSVGCASVGECEGVWEVVRGRVGRVSVWEVVCGRWCVGGGRWSAEGRDEGAAWRVKGERDMEEAQREG